MVLDRLVGSQLEREVVTACSDELDQCLEAWRDGALFPSGDDRSVSPGSFSQLRLGEPGPEACFSDEVRASHEAKYRLWSHDLQ